MGDGGLVGNWMILCFDVFNYICGRKSEFKLM